MVVLHLGITMDALSNSRIIILAHKDVIVWQNYATVILSMNWLFTDSISVLPVLIQNKH